MKKIRAFQMTILVIFSAALGGMFAVTPVYTEVYEGIVEVLCLSCIKLQPKTTTDFFFTTANNEPHPDFVLDNLSKGLLFLHYSGDSCLGCDIMYPVIKELFSINFGKQDIFSTTVRFDKANITFIYINIHHTTEVLKNSQKIYDFKDIRGIPMFTIITLGYDHGTVKPYYTTVYGTLGKDTDAQRTMFLTELLHESIEIYHQNKEGYHHQKK